MVSAMFKAGFMSAVIRLSNRSQNCLSSYSRLGLSKYLEYVERRGGKLKPNLFTSITQMTLSSQEIRSLIQEAEKRWGTKLDHILLGTAAHRAGQLDDPKLALTLLRRVQNVDLHLVLGRMLQFLEVTDGRKFVQDMIAKPVPESMNSTCLAAILKFCEQHDDSELARRVLTWRKGNLDQKDDFHHLLGALLPDVEITKSKKLIEDIIAKPVPKSMDSLDLDILLKFCERCVDVELGKRVWSWGKVVRDSVGPIVTYLMLCGKTGDMELVEQVWNDAVAAGMHSRPEVIGAMLSVLAAHGDVNQVNHLLSQVPLKKVNERMLASALTAYSHNGLANEAWNLLRKVESGGGRNVVGIHAYSAVVDAFARKGQFKSALDIVEKAKEKGLIPNIVTWMAILSPCRHYKELPTALHAFEEIRKLDPADPAAYVLMADVYRACGNVVAAEALHEDRLSRGLYKDPGAVTTTIHGKTYTFHVDEIPPELAEAALSIRAKLDEWSAWLVGQGVSAESIECRHSEMLALVHAVCQKEKNVILRKNLRVCTACHEASVHITRFEGITIHHWDRSRLHFMKDGKCSCGDFY